MKKLIAIVATILSFAMLLTACGTGGAPTSSPAQSPAANTNNASDTAASDNTNENVSGDGFIFALALPDTGTPPMIALANNTKNAVALAGGSYILPAALDFTPDGVISSVEQAIAAGATALYIVPPTDSILPTITRLCEESGVYWSISMRVINDENIRALVEASPYYVGNTFENEKAAAYEVMVYLNELGFKKIGILSQPVGDMATDKREEGIAQACEEFGMEVVAEARGLTQAADASSATESFLASNPDIDCIFVVGVAASGVQEAVAKTIKDAGRADAVKIATMDWPSEMDRLFEEGSLVVASSSAGPCAQWFDAYISSIKVINAVKGHPLESSSYSNTLSPYMVTDLETAKKVTALSNDENFKYFSDDYVNSTLFKWNNPNLNAQSLQTILDEYNPF